MGVDHTATGVRLIGAYFVLTALVFGSFGLGALDQGIGQFAMGGSLAMVLVGFGLLDGRSWGFTGGILGAFLAFVVNAMLFMGGQSIGMGGAVVSLLVVGYLIEEKGPSSSSWAPTGPRGP